MFWLPADELSRYRRRKLMKNGVFVTDVSPVRHLMLVHLGFTDHAACVARFKSLHLIRFLQPHLWSYSSTSVRATQFTRYLVSYT